eukprot:scaffold5_cov331-Pavlova_lutheri.AAC.5
MESCPALPVPAVIQKSASVDAAPCWACSTLPRRSGRRSCPRFPVWVTWVHPLPITSSFCNDASRFTRVLPCFVHEPCPSGHGGGRFPNHPFPPTSSPGFKSCPGRVGSRLPHPTTETMDRYVTRHEQPLQERDPGGPRAQKKIAECKVGKPSRRARTRSREKTCTR